MLNSAWPKVFGKKCLVSWPWKVTTPLSGLFTHMQFYLCEHDIYPTSQRWTVRYIHAQVSYDEEVLC